MTARVLYQNIVETATLSATSEATGFEKELALDWHPWSGWKPAITGTVYLTADLGSGADRRADTWAVFGHDLADNSAGVVVQYSSDNFSADINDAGDTVYPTDSRPVVVRFDAAIARYWRLKVISPTTARTIGMWLVGEGLDLPSVAPGFAPPVFGYVADSETTISEEGVPLGTSIYRRSAKTPLGLKVLDAAWLHQHWTPLAAHLEGGKPIILHPGIHDAQNRFNYSEQLDNAFWSKNRCSITANAVAAPDGTLTADKIVEDSTAANSHFIQRASAITVPAGATILAAACFRVTDPAERSWAWLKVNSGAGNGGSAYFNVASGAVGTTADSGTGTYIASRIDAYQEDASGTWYRALLVAAIGAADTTVNVLVALADADGSNFYNGDGSSGLYCWGVQAAVVTGVANPLSMPYVATEANPLIRHDAALCWTEGRLPVPVLDQPLFAGVTLNLKGLTR